jgi:hypothetical protein
MTNGSALMAFPLPDQRPVSVRPSSFLNNTDVCLTPVWEDKTKKKYLDEVVNAKAHTGKVEYDRVYAAQFIKAEAKAKGLMDVASAKDTKVIRAIETLLRRDRLGTRQRRLAMNSVPQAAE